MKEAGQKVSGIYFFWTSPPTHARSGTGGPLHPDSNRGKEERSSANSLRLSTFRQPPTGFLYRLNVPCRW